MMNPFFSFRGRFLSVAVVFLLLLASAALFTEGRVREIAETSRLEQVHHHQRRSALDGFFWILIEMEQGINRYARDPGEKRGRELVSLSAELDAYVDAMQIHSAGSHEDLAFGLLLAELEEDMGRVQAAVFDLVQSLGVSENRFPAMSMMMNGMMPLRREMDASLNLALDDFERSSADIESLHVYTIFQQLRYFWSQQLNMVRSFIANRSGVFGHPTQSMRDNLIREKAFSGQVYAILEQIQRLDEEGVLGLQQSETLSLMLEKKPQFDAVFKEVADIYLSENWRMDETLMRDRIDPAFTRIWATMQRLEEHIGGEALKRVQSTVRVAGTMSWFLWLFLAGGLLVMVFGLLIYEKTIHRPMMRVVAALEAEARGEEGVKVPPETSLETRLLIRAFGFMREKVRSRQRRLQSILDHTSDGIITLDSSGNIAGFNKAAEYLFGYSADEVTGKPVSLLMPEDEPGDSEGYLARYLAGDGLGSSGKEVERTGLKRDGTRFPVSVKSSELLLDGRRFYTSITADITERRVMMDRLKALAERDSLTNLYNRRYFLQELSRTTERVMRGSIECALLYIDLDNFKYVNDSMGHKAGDQVLLDVADLFLRRSRAGDLVARLGGDEFAILLYGIGRKAAMDVAEEYRRQLANYRFQHQGQVVDVGCSIGLAIMDSGMPPQPSILEQADIACHLAKQFGRNRVYLYQADKHSAEDAVVMDSGWSERINKALGEGRFKLESVDVIDLKERYRGLQRLGALMVDVDGREIGPEEYGRPAVRFGLQGRIDTWTLTQAAGMLHERRKHEPGCRIGVMLSARTLVEGQVFGTLQHLLRLYSLPAGAIMLQFREEEVVQNLSQFKGYLDELSTMGFPLAVSGVGAGAIQLAYLAELPVEVIWIADSLVGRVGEDELARLQVRAIVDMGHVLDRVVGAGGVADSSVVDLLRSYDIDLVQGKGDRPSRPGAGRGGS